jgi:hypothetical protein
MLLTDDVPKGFIRALLVPLIDELLSFTDNDEDAAWEAAEAATMSLNPRTVNEFRLAARVALFNILGNRLTVAANAPNLTPACSIRMRHCALSYVREADKTERRLEKLQADQPAGKPLVEAETAQATTIAATQTEPAATPAEAPATRTEAITTPAEAPSTQAEPTATPAEPATAQVLAAPIPAYKLLKQQRRLAKQQARNARLKAQADKAQDPNLPQAA